MREVLRAALRLPTVGEAVSDDAPKHWMLDVKDRPGALERALAGFKARGITVLHYQRFAGLWVFKVMRPRT